MLLYSTNNPDHRVTFREAVLSSMPADKGLYMPCVIPKLSANTIEAMSDMPFAEVAFEVAKALLHDEVPTDEVRRIVEYTVSFPTPVVMLSNQVGTLELFHGPSLAFKDFGARMMSQLITYYNRNENVKSTILVATSGDTGGAVGAGFAGVAGVEVIILYPKGKVSHYQELQMTTLGENIVALEVDGTFDDCQALVKRAFLDNDLGLKYRLSSANSINIGRLLPQCFYYFEACSQLSDDSRDIVISVPSGNFGNLTAGLIAKKMGAPISRFIAATNVNNVVPEYLENGEFLPKESVPTISNAMDVGNPSNFPRMISLYGSTWNDVKKDISGYYATDRETAEWIKVAYHSYDYICDPHGAIGFGALSDLDPDEVGIFLETAHPAKFLPVMDDILGKGATPIPERLTDLLQKPALKISIDSSFDNFKSFLLNR